MSTNRSARALPLLAAASVAFCSLPTIAQCELQWQPGLPLVDTNGSVSALVAWDPDGPGPRTPVAVIGGSFTAAGDVLANRIVAYDPATGAWEALGLGFNQQVRDLAVAANGDLLAVGDFTTAGGQPAQRVARWNGTAWSPLGLGLPAPGGTNVPTVQTVLALANGDVVVGGRFASAGGVPANNIARWNGSTWSALGAGTGPGPNLSVLPVLALAQLANGDLVAAGAFSTAGGVPAGGIARWDGAAWSALGSGLVAPPPTQLSVSDVAVRGTELIVAGTFTSAGGVPAASIAIWDGANWSPVGSGLQAVQVSRLAVLADGTLLGGGAFTAPGALLTENVARWDGANWVLLGDGLPSVVQALLPLPGGDILGASLGGPAKGLRRWNGAAWSLLSSGFLGSEARPLLRRRDGSVVVSGSFATPAAPAARHLAVLDAAGFRTLGGGADNVVRAAVEMPNGDLVIGGFFSEVGGTSVSRIARWNGSSWSPLGGATLGTVWALAVLPSGDLIAGGTFSQIGGTAADNIARWDGVAWTPLGTGTDGQVRAFAVLANGDLAVGGSFTVAGGAAANGLANWNGSSWSQLGSGPRGYIEALLLRRSGTLVAGGRFVNAVGFPTHAVAELTSGTWNPVGTNGPSPAASALVELPNGDLLAAPLWRWNGTVWSSIPTPGSAGSSPLALLVDPAGEVLVGGTYPAGFGRLLVPCPATATSWGSGCVGGGGPDVLTATSLPWLGSTFRAEATGLPPIALALVVHGFSTVSLPLLGAVPAGLAGCVLRVQPDDLSLALPAAGRVEASLVLPRSLALVGLVVHQQVLPIELDAQGGLLAITATNRLSLTLGEF
jgi:trimeric autotransporter adhesin